MNVLNNFLLCLLCVNGISQNPSHQHAPLEVETVIEKSCQTPPNGLGIPGFPPGSYQSEIRRMFGVPTRINNGYWPNTLAIAYDLIPNKVSLGFLFDKETNRLRQTEASFANNVDFKIMQMTLNSMLGCTISESIKDALWKISYGNSERFYFFRPMLKGIIERDDNQRIYIGVWQEDLH